MDTFSFYLTRMNRKKFIQQTSLASAALFLSDLSYAHGSGDFPVVRR
ncbi:MAG TPA: hypothetical protein PKA94_04115 [Ferruginibacter sp.]|nr:hypothetical protein [Ferruginibacter sp.]